MLILYSLALLLVLVVGSPWWLLRMATSGKYREGLAERLGRVPGRIRRSLGAERADLDSRGFGGRGAGGEPAD